MDKPHPNTPTPNGHGHEDAASQGEHAQEASHGHSAGEAHPRDNFKTILALLMALVVVSGAIITWRSTLDAEEATREDTVGITAAVQAQGAQVQSSVNAYQDYQAFTSYVRNEAVAQLLGQQIQALSKGPDANNPDTQAEIASLQQSMADSNNIANATRKYFQSRYIKPDGTYNLSGEISSALADQAKETDLAPDKHFEEALTMRNRSNDLLLALLIMGAALVCYTLASGPGHRYRVPIVVVGALLTIFALTDAIRVEFFT
jgi:hypothetical protein